MSGFGMGEEGASGGAADRALWRRLRAEPTEIPAEAQFMLLAAHADDRLDPDEAAAVAAALDRSPELAADVAVARALQSGPPTLDAALQDRLLSRMGTMAVAAPSVVSTEPRILPFQPRPAVLPLAAAPRVRGTLAWRSAASWGSLAAALAVASWLGFSLGSDATLAFAASDPGDETSLHELIDPALGAGFRELTDGARI